MDQEHDLICFSHVRWNFALQRPHHLMSLCAQERRVFFVEQPRQGDAAGTAIREALPNLFVVTPWLARGESVEGALAARRTDLKELCQSVRLQQPIAWFYTPMALEVARDLDPELIVYDCLDELHTVHAVPERLPELERELFDSADLVFIGGPSLFESKARQHSNVYLFPSSHIAHDDRATAAGQPGSADERAAWEATWRGMSELIDEALALGATKVA